jgi:hypothetical protein
MDRNRHLPRRRRAARRVLLLVDPPAVDLNGLHGWSAAAGGQT